MISESMKTLNRSERKKGQKFALFSNMFENITLYIITGALMMLYAGDVLGLPAGDISHIIALIPLVSLIRILLLPLLRKPGKVLLLRGTTLIQWFIILSMILIPPDRLSYGLYLFLLISFSLVRQLGIGTVWQPLLRDITTVNDRGRFFSRMRFVFTLVNLSVTGIIPLIIGDAITSREYKSFLILLLFTQLLKFFTLKYIPELPSVPAEKTPKNTMNKLKEELGKLKYPLLIQMLAQFSFFPVIVLYLRHNLALPANLVTLAIFVMTTGNALSLLFWGSVSDTLGFRNMMGGVHLLGLLQAPLLFIILPGTDSQTLLSLGGLFLYMFLNGLIMSGSGIGTTSIQHYFTNQNNSFTVLNIYASAALIGNSFWTFLTGSLLEKENIPLGAGYFWGSHFHLDGIKLFLLVLPFLIRLVLLILLRRLPNIKPWFGLGDFFTSLNPHSLRTMVLTSRLFRLDDRSREKAVRTFSRYKTPMGIHSLTELLKDPSYDVKVNAIRELGRTDSPLGGKRLFDLLLNPDMMIYHEHIIWALGELQWEEAVPILIELVESERNERERAQAARALGKIGSLEAVPALSRVLEEVTESFHLSSSACWALISLAPEEKACEIFQALPRYKDSNIRYEIMASLCPFLEISDQWLLKYAMDQGAYLALLESAESMSRSWREEKRPIILALGEKNFTEMEKLYHLRFPGNKPVTMALKACLPLYNSWNPLFLLAAARLLLLK
jgi:hypothetical protein